MSINAAFNEVNLNKVKDPEEEQFDEGFLPDDVHAISDAPSEEKAPAEADLAIAYNLKLKEG